MKNVSYLIQIPFVVVGFIVGTIAAGFIAGYIGAIEYWTD